MNKKNNEETIKYIEETIKYLEKIISVRVASFINEDYEIEEKLRQHTDNLLQKQTLLDLLIIKTTTESMVLKADVEEEIKRRIEDATKNND